MKKDFIVVQACRGFTLVEVITVMAIMMILIAALVVVGSGYGDKARAHETQATLGRIEQALEAYKAEFGAYPPDGYDSSVTTPGGYPLRGSACLTYFLAWKQPDGVSSPPPSIVLMKKSYADDPDNPVFVKANNGQPYLEDLDAKFITKAGEIVDGWKNPIHYDNVEYDPATKQPRFSPNPKGLHNCPDPDPRPRGPLQPGSFDLWSNGKDGHKRGAVGSNDIFRGERAK